MFDKTLNQRIQILVVDDHDIFRMGLVKILNDIKGLHVVGEASNGRKALTLLKSLKPHVVLMNLEMPEMDGIMATHQIVHYHTKIQVLVISAHRSIGWVAAMLHLGALGYLTKGSSVAELEQAIQSVYQGRYYVHECLMSELALKCVTYSWNQVMQSAFIRLSKREREVTYYIMSGYDNQKIAHQLNIQAKTVSTFRARIFEKLSVRSNIQLMCRMVESKAWLTYVDRVLDTSSQFGNFFEKTGF